MATSLNDNLPEVLKRLRTRPLFVMRLDVRKLLIVGATPDPSDVVERIEKGEVVNPTSYYLRTNPLFETAAAKYDWLNRVVAVGIGHRRADGPIYSSLRSVVNRAVANESHIPFLPELPLLACMHS